MLEACEAWGKAPWEVAGGSPVLWYERFVYRRRILIQEKEHLDGK